LGNEDTFLGDKPAKKFSNVAFGVQAIYVPLKFLKEAIISLHNSNKQIRVSKKIVFSKGRKVICKYRLNFTLQNFVI
jgi:hypothetical protein